MEVLRVICRFIFCFIFRVKVYGAEKMPEKGGVVVAANHEGMLDMFLIGYRLKRYVKWMAKEELFRNKILGKIFSACGAYPVKRNSRDIAAARTTFQMLEKGEAVGIFPQGTRSKGAGQRNKAKHGVAKFAVEAGVPVLPVAIWGKARLFGKIYVRFGDVINLPPESEKIKYTKQDYLNMSQEILDYIYSLMEVPENGNYSS